MREIDVLFLYTVIIMQQARNTIPQTYAKYFWDTNIANLELSKNSRYIIERILEYGNLQAWQWLFGEIPDEELIDTIKNSRNIGIKTAHFFQLYFSIPKEEIRCLQTVLPNKHLKMWPH